MTTPTPPPQPDENANPSPRPKRRPRYAGTHPRRFHEKYKELNPDRDPATFNKIIASGKTPAGTHRPICVDEIAHALDLRPGQIFVDATLGYGGHTLALLPKLLPGGRVLALDTDPIELPKTEARLRQHGYGPDNLLVQRMNFAGLARWLVSSDFGPVDAVLADLGCSSMQLDDPSRGFSFKLPGPLDLRMNPQKGQSAAALLTRATAPELQRILEENADEPHAHPISQQIITARDRNPIQTSTDLARVIRAALATLPQPVGEENQTLSVRRVFQALRIAVNEEYNALETFLRFLPDCVKPHGRIAILTFHSGEDRRVKKAFQEGLRNGIYSAIAQEVVRPTAQEISSNPRASSAKLRWAIRAGIETDADALAH